MINQPACTFSEDFYRFHWSDCGIELTMERFNDAKDDIRVEATVCLDHTLYGGRLYSGRLLLIGPNSRRDVRRELETRTGGPDNPDLDWAAILEQACGLARYRYRRGEPILDLTTVDYRVRPRYLLEPFVVNAGISIHYGDGKTSKSLFELWCSIRLALQGHKTLYLDWEDDSETHAERLAAICAGMGIDIALIEGMIHYQRRHVALRESAREVRRAVAELGIDFVVVDSLGMAAGDPNDHGLVIESVRAARSFGVAVSCIHHLPKDAKDKSKPFGSVYASNEARLTWLFEKAQDEGKDELNLLLTNHAFNRGKQYPKQAYKVRFTKDGDLLTCVEFEETDIAAVESFRSKLKQHELIADALKANGRLRPADIADVLAADGISVTPNAIGTVLRRHEGKLFVRLEGGAWGLMERTQTV